MNSFRIFYDIHPITYTYVYGFHMGNMFNIKIYTSDGLSLLSGYIHALKHSLTHNIWFQVSI